MFRFYKSKSPSKSPGRASRPKSKSRKFRPLHWLRLAVVFFLASTVAAVLFFRFVPPPLTPLMAVRCLEQIGNGKPLRLDKDWTSLGKISPRLAEAVIASEDQRFFDHNGFDWDAISSAFTANGRGKRKLGASTITQQTAKNLFLWPDRSWTRKGLEAYFTLLLELLWSKRRILEVYLNIIETGDGTYGAEAAARRYFQVTSSALGAPQAALIAAILPNPRVWSPANPSGYLRRRQTWILRQMAQLGPLPDGLSRDWPPAALSGSKPVPPGSKAVPARPRPAALKPDSGKSDVHDSAGADSDAPSPAPAPSKRTQPPGDEPGPEDSAPPYPDVAPDKERVPIVPAPDSGTP